MLQLGGDEGVDEACKVGVDTVLLVGGQGNTL